MGKKEKKKAASGKRGRTRSSGPPVRKPRADAVEAEGIVREELANTRFRVELDDGRMVMAYLGGKMRKNFIRVSAGDRVVVELSIYSEDVSLGRIVYRYK